MTEEKKNILLEERVMSMKRLEVRRLFQNPLFHIEKQFLKNTGNTQINDEQRAAKSSVEDCFTMQHALQPEFECLFYDEPLTRAVSTAYSFYLSAYEALSRLPADGSDPEGFASHNVFVTTESPYSRVSIDWESFKPAQHDQFLEKITKTITDRRLTGNGIGPLDLLRQGYEFILKETYDFLNRPEFDKYLKVMDNVDVIYSGKILNSIESEVKRIETSRAYAINSDDMTFDDFGGYHAAKERCRRLSVQIRNHAAMQRRQRKPYERAILFHGPSGTGKTELAKIMARETGAYFMIVTRGEIADTFKDGSTIALNRIFKDAARIANTNRYPAVIVYFDEMDSIAGKRGNHKEDDKDVNTLLSNIDGNALCTDVPVIIAGSTNLDYLIDDAAKRPGRFDLIPMPAPDRKSRADIFSVIISKMNRHAKEYNSEDSLFYGIDHDRLADITEGFTGAHIRHFLETAVRDQSVDYLDQGVELIPENIRPIDQDHLMKRLEEYKREKSI